MPVRRLRPDQQQMVEIARALSIDARVLILDEPTSSLTEDEVDALFGLVRRLRDEGVATIFVSHRLGELFALADRVTVLRDGHTVGGGLVADFDRPRLIALMVGRELENFDATHDGASDVADAVLRVRDFSLGGRVRRRLARRRAGRGRRASRASSAPGAPSCSRRSSACTARTARVEVAGQPALFRHPRAAIAAGVGFVPADRKLQGLVQQMSVRDNLMMAASSRTGRYRVPRKAVETELVRSLIKDMSIRAHAPGVPVSTLSGGNQQKVVLGKWLATEPQVLMLDEPTRGVDVGAKAEIYKLLGDAAQRGLGDPGVIVRDPRAAGALRPHHRDVPRPGRHVTHARGSYRGAHRTLRRGAPVNSTMSDQPSDRRRQGMLNQASGMWSAANRYAVVLTLLVGLFIFFSATQDNFFTQQNVENLLTSVSILWVVSIGMTFVVLTAGIDLSVGSLLALTGIVLSKLFNDVGLPAPLAVLAAIAIAALIGARRQRRPDRARRPLVLRRHARHALALPGHREPLVAHRRPSTSPRRSSAASASARRSASRRRSGSWLGDVPVAFVVLRWTYFGRDVYAVGGNIEAARLSGINVARTLMIVYGIAGLCAGIAGCIQVGRLGAASPMVGADIPLNAAAAVLLGGTSFLGGVGGVSGTAVGVLFIGTLQNGLAIAGVQSFWQQVVTGVILIVAIAIDRVQQQGASLWSRKGKPAAPVDGPRRGRCGRPRVADGTSTPSGSR